MKPILVKFTSTVANRHEVAINIVRITRIEPVSDRGTKIFFDGETSVGVVEKLDEVINRISLALKTAE